MRSIVVPRPGHGSAVSLLLPDIDQVGAEGFTPQTKNGTRIHTDSHGFLTLFAHPLIVRLRGAGDQWLHSG